MRRVFATSLVIALVLIAAPRVRAVSSLTFVSDLISDSSPASPSNHTFSFTVSTGIAASGKVFVVPQAGSLTIPVGVAFDDVDLAVNGVDRTLGAAAGVGTVGVTVVSGMSGSIMFTLSSSTGLSSGDDVVIEIGTHATFGGAGDQQFVNPAAAGSYPVSLSTYTPANVLQDEGTAMYAIIQPVDLDVGPTPTPTPPGGGGGGTICDVRADFNDDCRVNIYDLSIMMYNWPIVRNEPRTDLNDDGIVGIIDFSVLLYWWTG